MPSSPWQPNGQPENELLRGRSFAARARSDSHSSPSSAAGLTLPRPKPTVSSRGRPQFALRGASAVVAGPHSPVARRPVGDGHVMRHGVQLAML